jgi:hypothetical protein
MMEHDARLDQAGALQNSQSPVDAVSGGDGPTMEPPLMAALFRFAHIGEEIAKR